MSISNIFHSKTEHWFRTEFGMSQRLTNSELKEKEEQRMSALKFRKSALGRLYLKFLFHQKKNRIIYALQDPSQEGEKCLHLYIKRVARRGGRVHLVQLPQ